MTTIFPRGGACARATTAAPTSPQRSLREGVSAAAAPILPTSELEAAAPFSPWQSRREDGGCSSILAATELA
jgi:hypothetical protein